MKKIILSFVPVLFLTTSPALAADKGTAARGTTVARKSGAPSTTTASSYRAPSGDVGTSSASRLGLGFATYGTSYFGASLITSPGFSVWYDLDSRMSLQGILAVNSSDPFAFGVAGIFRYTLHGSQANGFHGGIGFNLGTQAAAGAAAAGGGTTKFFLDIFPTLGLHFSLGGHVSNVQLSFDGGPVFAITPSPFQFGMSSFGLLGGASIHYFF